MEEERCEGGWDIGYRKIRWRMSVGEWELIANGDGRAVADWGLGYVFRVCLEMSKVEEGSGGGLRSDERKGGES